LRRVDRKVLDVLEIDPRSVPEGLDDAVVGLVNKEESALCLECGLAHVPLR
jgi:hypothetical protein